MDYLGKNDDYRARNKSRDSHSRNDIHSSSRYDRTSSSSHRSRSRSHDRSRSKPRTFYDSSTRSHQYSASLQSSSSQRQFNRYEDNGHNPNNSFNSAYNDSNKSSHVHGGRPGSFNPGQPSRTIMLRQLPFELDDSDIYNELNMQNVPYKDMRLVKNRDNGQSRGFAFVEFNTVEEAQKWMTSTQGCIMFPHYDNRVQMFYSSTKEDQGQDGSRITMANDWDCANCGIKNFKRRDQCFKCSMSKEESDRRSGGVGYDYTSSVPCDTLVLRGLDALTTAETIASVINTHTNYCLTIKSLHIARDHFTRASSGFAFLEMNSNQEASNLIEILHQSFVVDGKKIAVNFSKHPYQTALTQLAIETRLDYQPSGESHSNNYHSNNAKNNGNNKLSRPNQGDRTNSAAAVAQAAMASMHKKQELISHLTCHLKHEATPQVGTHSALYSGVHQQNLISQANVYTAPDPSKFAYDETSGYYYDYSTGFYYDAKSQYYFNSLTQQYMYWDPATLAYIAVGQSGEPAAVAESTEPPKAESPPEPVVEEKKPKNVPKTAAQIAKEMEMWAKSQNTKKITVPVKKQPVTVLKQTPAIFTPTTSNSPIESAQQEPEEAVQLEKESSNEPESPKDQDNLKMTTSGANEAQCQESSNEALASPQKSLEEMLASLIDTAKMACLLCKRRFDSVEILNKHIAKSDLHKTNLEKFKKENQLSEITAETRIETTAVEKSDSLTAALQYRDRANERRIKYGAPSPPSVTQAPSSSKKPYGKKKESKKRDFEFDQEDNLPPYKMPASNPPLENTESVASKLMKKMGWNEGTGLGKNLQGISAPIEATMRQKGAGLGAAGGYDMDPNDSYSDAVRKSARARYESLL